MIVKVKAAFVKANVLSLYKEPCIMRFVRRAGQTSALLTCAPDLRNAISLSALAQFTHRNAPISCDPVRKKKNEKKQEGSTKWLYHFRKNKKKPKGISYGGQLRLAR